MTLRATTVLVNSGNDFREDASSERGVESRLKLLSSLPGLYPESDLFLLPAGYLCTSTMKDIDQLAKEAEKAITATGSAATFVFGVDGTKAGTKGGAKSDLRGADTNGYPFVVFAVGPELDATLKFQQLAAYSSEDNKDILGKLWHRRSVALPGGRSASVLICGEIWCRRALHHRIAGENSDVILLCAHQAAPLGNNPKRSLTVPIGDLRQKAKVPVLMAQHTRSAHRHSHVWPISAWETPTYIGKKTETRAWVTQVSI